MNAVADGDGVIVVSGVQPILQRGGERGGGARRVNLGGVGDEATGSPQGVLGLDLGGGVAWACPAVWVRGAPTGASAQLSAQGPPGEGEHEALQILRRPLPGALHAGSRRLVEADRGERGLLRRVLDARGADPRETMP